MSAIQPTVSAREIRRAVRKQAEILEVGVLPQLQLHSEALNKLAENQGMLNQMHQAFRQQSFWRRLRWLVGL